MFPNYCGVGGYAGWLVMLLLWVGVVALVVWGVARLFPNRSRTDALPPPGDRPDEPVRSVTGRAEDRPRPPAGSA